MSTTTPARLEDAGLHVYSDGSDEIQWLDARRGMYTATQVTAIVGSNPYTKVIDVWNSFTDPEFDPDAERNRWLEERAAFGQQREPEIIKWASEDERTGGPRNPFIASKALVGLPDLMGSKFASTPDGYKFARDRALVLIECKASQQFWERDGIPQHIYDQIQWQIHTTGAITVWLAQERIEWTGRGANKVAKVADTYLTPIQRDELRIAYMLGRVEWFEGLLAANIAPESDIDLREVAASEPDPFEASDEELADWQEAVATIEALDELAEIRERIAADTTREAVLVEQVKGTIKQYEGRRVHLIGQRFIAKLIRGTRTNVNTKALTPEVLRPLTSWSETETVKFEPNPEYVAPATAETEQE